MIKAVCWPRPNICGLPDDLNDAIRLYMQPVVATVVSDDEIDNEVQHIRIEPMGVRLSCAADTRCLKFSEDGKWLVNANNDGTLRIWNDYEHSVDIYLPACNTRDVIMYEPLCAETLAFQKTLSLTSSSLLACGTNNNNVFIFDMFNGATVYTISNTIDPCFLWRSTFINVTYLNNVLLLGWGQHKFISVTLDNGESTMTQINNDTSTDASTDASAEDYSADTILAVCNNMIACAAYDGDVYIYTTNLKLKQVLTINAQDQSPVSLLAISEQYLACITFKNRLSIFKLVKGTFQLIYYDRFGVLKHFTSLQFVIDKLMYSDARNVYTIDLSSCRQNSCRQTEYTMVL
jgi:WD40 repeat protein